MSKKRLSVSAIEKGTVIDHIPPHQGLQLVRLLRLDEHEERLTIGLNLSSSTMGSKDLIKIEGRELSPEEANQVAVFAPDITIAIIENYLVLQKFKVALPQQIERVVNCPNERCITNHETITTLFSVCPVGSSTELQCHYCSHRFPMQSIRPTPQGGALCSS